MYRTHDMPIRTTEDVIQVRTANPYNIGSNHNTHLEKKSKDARKI